MKRSNAKPYFCNIGQSTIEKILVTLKSLEKVPLAMC